MIVDVMGQAKLIEIHRTRKISFPGRVLVKIGETVEPGDVIAEGVIPNDYLVIDLCDALGVPAGEVSSCLVREEGEIVQEGDILAQSEGAIERVVRAPSDGRIVDCTQGELILAVGEHLFRIQAGMVGVVDDVIPEMGAVIKVRGTLLQGYWGNGKFDSGPLFVIEDSIDQPLELTHITDVEAGQVVAAGFCQDEDVLVKLADKGVSGIILGAMAPSLIKVAKELSVPVIVLQGFGNLQPDKQGFDLLKSRVGEVASINASCMDRDSGIRPEVVLLYDEGKPEEDLGFRSELMPGQRVQVNSGKNWGKMGVIIDLPKTPVEFENGLWIYPAVVQIEDEDVIKVPVQNLIIVS